MREVSIDRLFTARRGLILYGMKKPLYHALTTEELYALDKRARQERARYVGALLAAAAVALKSRFERAVSALSAKAVRHA
jgi:hypothetical protein